MTYFNLLCSKIWEKSRIMYLLIEAAILDSLHGKKTPPNNESGDCKNLGYFKGKNDRGAWKICKRVMLWLWEINSVLLLLAVPQILFLHLHYWHWAMSSANDCIFLYFFLRYQLYSRKIWLLWRRGRSLYFGNDHICLA